MCYYQSNECRWPIERHHIIFRSEIPRHPERDNPRNILPVCSYHHKRLHDKKDRRRDIVIERDLNSLYPDVLHDRYKPDI